MGVLPRQRFLDSSVKVSMITYSITARAMVDFDFTYQYGHYREMIKRGVRQAEYQGEKIPHNTIISHSKRDYLVTKGGRFVYLLLVCPNILP